MIIGISLNYLNADLSVRSDFQFSKAELNEIYPELKQLPGLLGLIIISTCNRTEIYVHANDAFEMETVLESLQTYKSTNIPSHFFQQLGKTKETVKYMLEVTNGLHSMALGDKQIIGQFKEAFLISQTNGMISGPLERIFQAAFRSHKRISNETSFHNGSQSVSYLAVDAIRKRFFGKSIKIFVIGAGSIATDLLKYLHSMDYSNVTITNRTMVKAEKLAQQHEYAVAAYDLSEEILANYEVIISCAAQNSLLTPELVIHLKNKLLIDLTISNSIVRPNYTCSNELITLDELAKKKRMTSVSQASALTQVEEIIREELAIFLKWSAPREIAIRQAVPHISSSFTLQVNA